MLGSLVGSLFLVWLATRIYYGVIDYQMSKHFYKSQGYPLNIP